MNQENSDTKLISQAAAGDKDALEKIVEMHQSLMRYIAKSVLKDEEMINDVVQESSILVYRFLYQLRDPSCFQQWLSSIVLNTARQHIRNQKHTPLSLEAIQQENLLNEMNEDTSISNPYDEIEKKFIESTIWNIVMQLSMKERDVIFLFYYLDYSTQEIADLLHVTVASIKSRLYKARKHLAARLSPSTFFDRVPAKPERILRMTQSDNHIPDFTDDKIAMYQYAIAEAPKLGSKHIGTEHLLLGIVHVYNKDISQILEDMHITEENIRHAISLGYGDLDKGRAGLTPSGKDALEISQELSRRLGSPQIGCEHMLFSILQIQNCGALTILESLQADIDSLSASIIRLLLKSSPTKKANENILKDIFALKMTEDEQKTGELNRKSDHSLFDEHIKTYQKMIQQEKYEKRKEELEKWNEKLARLKEITAEYSMEPRFPSFSLTTTVILSLAEEESKKYGARVSPAFLFLGFMRQDEQSFPEQSVLLHALKVLDVDCYSIYTEISSLLEQGKGEIVRREGNALDNVYLSGWSDISILAYEVAIRRRSSSVEPEHLFLGLLHYLEFAPVPMLEKYTEMFHSLERVLELN